MIDFATRHIERAGRDDERRLSYWTKGQRENRQGLRYYRIRARRIAITFLCDNQPDENGR